MSWLETIQAAIQSSGKTTYRIAKESGVPVQTLDAIVDGRDPKISTVERIAPHVGLELRQSKRRPRSDRAKDG